MKKVLLFVLSGILGLLLGLVLNGLAHRYSSWLYQAHYGEAIDPEAVSVPRFFAAPIYAALGFFGALYAVVSSGGSARKSVLFFGIYGLGNGLGFGASLLVHPLFHCLTSGGLGGGDAAFKAYIGLDVFVCPLIVFLAAIAATRWIKSRS